MAELAPDVVGMVKRLEQFAFHLRTIENQYAETMREKIDRDAAELMEQAAAMIEKLGQRWIPSARFSWGTNGMVTNKLGGYVWIDIPPPPERP